VPTPEELLPDLIEDVVAGNTQPDGGTSLLAKLAAALHNLTREDPAGPPNYAAAINALKAFINEVKAQRGKTITQEDADHWIALAQQIIDQLSDK
jgi:hypothetical protein